MQEGLNQLWATPFLYGNMNNEVYRNDICEYLFQNTNMYTPPSDFSKTNILDSEDKPIQDFKKNVIEPTVDRFLKESVGKSLYDWKSFRMQGWLAGMRNEYTISLHNHKGSQISCVFYLLAEEMNSGGTIVFTDPRQNANRGYDENFNQLFDHELLTPKSGDYVVFPSFLYHFVTTYQSNLRIAMPVDIFLY